MSRTFSRRLGSERLLCFIVMFCKLLNYSWKTNKHYHYYYTQKTMFRRGEIVNLIFFFRVFSYYKFFVSFRIQNKRNWVTNPSVNRSNFLKFFRTRNNFPESSIYTILKTGRLLTDELTDKRWTCFFNCINIIFFKHYFFVNATQYRFKS